MPRPPLRTDFAIGAIGCGFIMRDIQLPAYRSAGFRVAGLAGTSREDAQSVAELRGVPRVYDDWRELIRDDSIEILDIAVPPHIQPRIIAEAAGESHHIKGILA